MCEYLESMVTVQVHLDPAVDQGRSEVDKSVGVRAGRLSPGPS